MIIRERSYKPIDFHGHAYEDWEAPVLKRRFAQRDDEYARKFRDRDLSVDGLNEAMRSSGVGCSDHPYHDMAFEKQRIENLGLSDSELEAVMYGNAWRLLNERE